MTFKVCNVRSKYPYFNRAYVVRDMQVSPRHTLTDLNSRSLLNTSPPLSGLPAGVWRSLSQIKAFLIDYQVLKELKLENQPKSIIFDQI